MTAAPSPFCAAVDWGTSSFRLWLLARDGSVLGERRSREGMNTAGGAGFGPTLENHLAILQASAALPVIVCGMAGARQGWVEAPYVDTPADLSRIAEGAITVAGAARAVRILPGVAQRAVGETRADVMRGEETQAMGLGLAGDALLCMPGTHSKWVSLASGRIAGFSTFMTGEVFALLSEQSILRHAVSAGGDVLSEREAFAGGVADAIAEPSTILNRLFSLRADGLFGQGSPAAALARLSGLVLGLEIAGGRALYPATSSMVLVASGALLALYREAFAAAGYTVEEADADEAVRKGLHAAALTSFPETQGSST
ncbi:MAG: 2-dehydro-3-deoxygalactonokinase [Rhizobiaceae bacterium]|nr:2-dehydro-3-deoxygalactonokinase [Rhizobiaceae bacterium]